MKRSNASFVLGLAVFLLGASWRMTAGAAFVSTSTLRGGERPGRLEEPPGQGPRRGDDER